MATSLDETLKEFGICDITEWDGVLCRKISFNAKDDGVDRKTECFTEKTFNLEKFAARRVKYQQAKKYNSRTVFNGILSNEVTFVEFFERDQYDRNKQVRIFYSQLGLFLDPWSADYCGRKVGKTWAIKWKPLQRIVRFPGSKYIIWSHDDAHVKPRSEETFKILDSHPFFAQLVPKRGQQGRSRTPPYEQQFLNGCSLYWVYPGRDGSQLEKFHVEGALCDECLGRDTLITLADGSQKTVKDIVDSKYQGDVLSYNIDTGVIEPKKITGWYKNVRRNRSLYDLNGLIATEDHPVYTSNRGYQKIADLHSGDKVLVLDNDEFEHREASWRFLGSGSVQFFMPIKTGLEEPCVYCIDVEDNHNFFAGGILVHNSQDILDIHMDKFIPTQNDFRADRGSLRCFYGVNSQGRTDSPFYKMTFKDPAYKGHVWIVPSWNNPREYSLKVHDGYLRQLGGSIDNPKFRQMIRGKLGDKIEGVFNPRSYDNCCEKRRLLEVDLKRTLPYKSRKLDLSLFERRKPDALVPVPIDIGECEDIRGGMDFGFGGAPTVIEIYFLIQGVWHLGEHFDLFRIPEPRQADFLHHLINREGTGLYPDLSYIGIDVTGNRNIYSYLTDASDTRFNARINDYSERVVPINFEKAVVAQKSFEKLDDATRLRKCFLADGSVAWDVMVPILPFSTKMISDRMAEIGYSLPEEDDERRAEYIYMIQDGNKFYGHKGKDHTIAANRCFELTIHEKKNIPDMEAKLLYLDREADAYSSGLSAFIDF